MFGFLFSKTGGGFEVEFEVKIMFTGGLSQDDDVKDEDDVYFFLCLVVLLILVDGPRACDL